MLGRKKDIESGKNIKNIGKIFKIQEKYIQEIQETIGTQDIQEIIGIQEKWHAWI